MIRRISVSISLILLPFLMIAQVKVEKEIRIKKKHVPSQAIGFVNKINLINKVKWSKKYSLKDTTLEAKTQYRKSTSNIEFTLLGKVKNVEQAIGWESIATDAQAKILVFLKQEHSTAQIQKVQVQYSGNEEDLLLWINKKDRSNKLVVKYEITLAAETEQRKQHIEYLFSESGVMERKAFLLFKDSDTLTD